MSEEYLIIKSKAENRQAMSLLYDSYQHHWFMICLRYNKNRMDAADVLQNALINIFSKIKQFDHQKGNFKSWSSKIVVNENLAFFRAKGSNLIFEDLDQSYDMHSNEESALDKLSAKELIAIIQELPSGYRTIFNLYVLEGYNHKEIADLLNISEGTSKSQLFKAKRILKEKLESLFQGVQR